MFQSAMLTLESWLDGLPTSTIAQRPRLQSLRGAVATMRGRAAEAVQVAGSAVAQLRQQEDCAGPRHGTRSKGHARRFVGDYSNALQDAAEALKITEDNEGLRALFADALRLRGLILFRKGQTRQALDDLQGSLAIHVHQDDTSVPHLLMETAMAQACSVNIDLHKVRTRRRCRSGGRAGISSSRRRCSTTTAICTTSWASTKKLRRPSRRDCFVPNTAATNAWRRCSP